MAEIEALVVPYDGSKLAARALPIARDLAERADADVVLVTSSLGGGGALPDELEDARSRLGGLAVRWVELDDRCAASAILDTALVSERRLVVMSTHGRSGLGRAVLGSVARKVIHSGVVPVLVVGPASDPTDSLIAPGQIQLCIDGSERSLAVAEAGREWAALLDVDVQMQFVVNPMDTVTPREADVIFGRCAGPLLDDGLHAIGEVVVASSVPSGLVAEAHRLKSPVSIVAPAVRSSFAELALGSTTMTLLRHAPCPVLVVPGSTPEPTGGRR
jgi:nucleotide-binding universal stress UspA family protein